MFLRSLVCRHALLTCVSLAAIVLAVGCDRKPGASNKPDGTADAKNSAKAGAAADGIATTVPKGDSADDAQAEPLVESAAPAGATNDDTADQILKKMAAAYQNASNYADSGEFMAVIQLEGGEPQEQGPMPVSVTFEKPNKLRLHAFDSMVVVDGKKLWASIASLEDQVVSLDAPESLTLAGLLTDPLLAEAMQGGIYLPQLALLVGDDPLGEHLKDAETPERLSDRKLGPDICQRVLVKSDAGDRIYWIDAKSHVLRRMQFPTVELKRAKDPEGKLKSLTLTATFNGARFDAKVPPQAFAFEVPDRAKLLSHFLPPPPEAISTLLGQKLDDFTFEDLEGKTVDAESLKGKIVVVDVWATWCGWCFRGFPNLQKVYEQYKDNDKIMFLTLNTDTPDVSNDEVQASFEKAGITLPIVRDTKNQSGDLLGVQGLPTMFILAADGTVQLLDRGYHADLAETLPPKLEKLLAGETLADEQIEEYKAKRAEYDKQMAEALGGTSVEVEVPQTEIGEPSEASTLKLDELWKAEVKKPGNILVVDGASEPAKIFVLEGVHNVIELDTAGKTVAKHQLHLPEGAVVSFVRTGVDGDGNRYYAAFASGEQQLHLFDGQWKKLLSYPDPRDGAHSGIMDVQLADVDGDGHLEFCVAYGGIVGVQCVTSDGNRIWSNRALENVFSLALVPGEDSATRLLLCANARDRLTTIDYRGKTGAIVPLPERGLHTVVAANPSGDAPGALAGLSSSQVGRTVAIGLDLEKKELWDYTLPPGIHQMPVPVLSAVRLVPDSPGQWLLAGADGSLHLVSQEGKPLDKFNYGEALSGLASTTIDNQPVLLVATPKALTAWKVSAK